MKVAVIGAAALSLAAMATGAVAAVLPLPERVSFASLDQDAAGNPVRISALLYRPTGPTPVGGHPAVIVLHGCGGMYGAARGPTDLLSRRHHAWAGERWRPAPPTRIFIGEKDDWTPAAPCVALGQAHRARGEFFEVTVYADSYHGFDSPSGRLVVRKDVPGGVSPGQGVTVGPNFVAGAEARAKTRAFLRERLAPSGAARVPAG